MITLSISRPSRRLTRSSVKNPQVHTVYISPDVWETLGKIADALNTSISGLFRNSAQDIIEQYTGGKMKPKFDLQSKKAGRLKLMKEEDSLYKLLRRTLPNKRSVYATLCDFADTNQALDKGPEEALAKMQVYICNGSEPFNDSNVEDFVEYIETVLKRRQIELEIKNHRRQQNGL